VTSERPTTTATAVGRSLVSLLGETRATIVEDLRRAVTAPSPSSPTYLGISEVATRRHLAVLEDEGWSPRGPSTRGGAARRPATT
jgi:predicted ArsR family transcriptional regulator